VTKTAGTPKRMVPDRRRATILRAAGELFSQHPYADVSVADIARAARVSPPLIVFHFGTKKALYLAVLAAAADAIRSGLAALPGPPSIERLQAGVRFYAEYAHTHRTGFLSLLRGGQEFPEAAAVVESLRTHLATQLEADLSATRPALAASVLTPVAVRAHLGYVDAAITGWLSLPDPARAEITPGMLANLAAATFTAALSAISLPVKELRVYFFSPAFRCALLNKLARYFARLLPARSIICSH
jgi:AcrR family transcriptional regulator